MSRVTIYDDCNEVVAKQRGVRHELYTTADAGAVRAIITLNRHRDQGHSRIELEHGDLDWYVILSDERGDKAAAAIEYGRRTKDGGKTDGVWALHDAFDLPHRE